MQGEKVTDMEFQTQLKQKVAEIEQILEKYLLKTEAERKNVSEEKLREYVKILSEMINCKTVFTENGENKAEFEKFYSLIEKNFPNITAKAEKLVFGYTTISQRF